MHYQKKVSKIYDTLKEQHNHLNNEELIDLLIEDLSIICRIKKDRFNNKRTIEEIAEVVKKHFK